MKKSITTISNLREEYMDISENMRHYGGGQYTQLTVLVAIMAGFLTLLFATDKPLPYQAKIILKLAGLIVTLLFWMSLESGIYVWHHFKKRAIHLEKELSYKQYSTLPEMPRLIKLELLRYGPGSWSIRLICLFLTILWLIMIFVPNQF